MNGGPRRSPRARPISACNCSSTRRRSRRRVAHSSRPDRLVRDRSGSPACRANCACQRHGGARRRPARCRRRHSIGNRCARRLDGPAVCPARRDSITISCVPTDRCAPPPPAGPSTRDKRPTETKLIESNEKYREPVFDRPEEFSISRRSTALYSSADFTHDSRRLAYVISQFDNIARGVAGTRPILNILPFARFGSTCVFFRVRVPRSH